MSGFDVRHCPRCELRFSSRPELVEHLVADHRFARDTVEPLRYPAGQPRTGEVGAPGRRCLVVANQTIGGPELRAAIRDRIEAGTTRFLVLVPATSSRDQVEHAAAGIDIEGSAGRGRGAASPTDEQGLALAAQRLRAVVDALRDEGCDAHGDVGPADPEAAVHQLLRTERVDEILVATLPVGVSRWLGIDLPGRLRRQFRLPVTTVITRSPSVAHR